MLPTNPLKVDVKRPVTITLSNGQKAHAQSLDLSPQGLSITYTSDAIVGSHLDLQFNLVVNSQIYEINIKAKVSFCYLSGAQYHVGFDFENLSEENKNLIDQFIEYKKIAKAKRR